MLVLVLAILGAALIPLVTLGSYKRLILTDLHWGWVLAIGLGIQLGLEYYTLPRQYWHDLGFGLLVASYVLVLAFVGRNLLLRGMGIVLVGIACNALVITLNQGMPVKLPPEWKNKTWAQATVKHHPQKHGEKMLILSDIIIVKSPVDVIMSFGDLILAVGLCDVAYNVSRDPKRRRAKARRKLEARYGPLPPVRPEPDAASVSPPVSASAESGISRAWASMAWTIDDAADQAGDGRGIRNSPALTTRSSADNTFSS